MKWKKWMAVEVVVVGLSPACPAWKIGREREREGGKRRFARSFLFSPALERTADDVKGNL